MENDITAVCHASKDTLLTATSHGVICVWSVIHRHCFLHWQADSREIGTKVLEQVFCVFHRISSRLSMFKINKKRPEHPDFASTLVLGHGTCVAVSFAQCVNIDFSNNLK